MRKIGVGLAITALVIACSVDRSTPAPRGESHRAQVSQSLSSSLLIGTSLAAKQLVLTFDDGPGDLLANGISVTRDLSAYLKNRPTPIKATFFVNGACIAATALPNDSCGAPMPQAIQSIDQIMADGHLLANHSTTHRSMPSVPAGQIVQDLADTDTFVAPRVPWNRFFFRPPYGDWSVGAYNTLHASAMDKYVGPIYWDVGGGPTGPTMAADWECWQNNMTTKACGDRYLAEIRTVGKGIVLMHDPRGNIDNHNINVGTGNTVDMVKYIVPILEAEGFTFKTLADVPTIAALLPTCNAACTTCSGPNANQCLSCPAGSFLVGTTCQACSVCGPGTYASTACTPTANTVCSACTVCTSDTYASAACTPTTNTVCTACTVCGAGFYASTQCSPTINRVCAACHPSCTACSGPDVTQCGACPEGFFNKNGTCTTCSTCKAGTFKSGACTGMVDTACTPCPVGTSSATDDAASCTACAPGTFAASAGSKECTACGDCNDNDACTEDTCDVMKGCVHTKRADCNSSSTSTSSSSGATENDAGEPAAPGGDGESGCNIGPSSRSQSGSSAALGALAFLFFFRRRRAP